MYPQSSSFDAHALKLNDIMDVFPFGERKYRVNLKRTLIDIIPELHPPHHFIQPIRLPRQEKNFHYQLILDQFKGHEGFSMKTLVGDPFLINGQYTKECFVEKNDVIFIGDHRLVFQGTPYQMELLNWGEHEILSQEKLIKSTLPILMEGETGTGKSHLAKLIHERSERKGAFVHINLASYSPSLIESELFGHQKGAFTGAIQESMGAFRLAHQGTLFLDEMDSLSYELQTKLLLFFDHQTIRPVGSTKEYKVQARILAASGRCVKKLVEQKLLRPDLFYRLTSGYHLRLKPLRDDLLSLEKFLDRYMFDKGVTISLKLRNFYKDLGWPGNIRQLKGHLDLKLELNKGKKLDFDHWDEKLIAESTNLERWPENGEIMSLDQMKKEYVLRAYRLNHQKMSVTAKQLNISLKTLQRMISEKECK
jgi:transcriptional regulator of acetoin/glycerol metabolism